MPRTKLSKTKTRTPSPPTSSQVFEGAQALALVPGQFLAPSSSLAHSSTSTASVGAAPAPAPEVDQLRERFDALAPPEPRLNPVAAFAALVCSPPPQNYRPVAPPAAAALVLSPPPRKLPTEPPKRPTAEFLALMAETHQMGKEINDIVKELIAKREWRKNYLQFAEKFDACHIVKGPEELFLDARLQYNLENPYSKLSFKFSDQCKTNNWSLNAAELSQKYAIEDHYKFYVKGKESMGKLDTEIERLVGQLSQRGF